MRPGFALLIMLMADVACAGGAFAGFDLGLGDLDLKDVQVTPEFDLTLGTNDNTIVTNFNGGYEFDNGFSIVAAAETTDRLTILGLGDAVEIDVLRAGIGFGAAAAPRFRLHGTIGLAFWKLQARESFFLNPGPEATASIDGDDLYIEIGGEYLFNDLVSLVFLYNYNDYEFGDATATRIGVRFRFLRN